MSFLPLIHTEELKCGCVIKYYGGEVEPGKSTVIDQVDMCPKHEDEYTYENRAGD